MWDWPQAIKGNAILKAIDAMFEAVARERAAYQRSFGVVPTFRVGVHGGDVVGSEQGETKRSIGIYWDTINIAAPMGKRRRARAPRGRCVSRRPAAAAPAVAGRFRETGEEETRGIWAPVWICEPRPGGLSPGNGPGTALSARPPETRRSPAQKSARTSARR